MSPLAITSFGTWTSGGGSVNAAPRPGTGGELGLWQGAPELTRIHPRARRPHPIAKAMVQLGHEVLATRPDLPRERMAQVVGGEAGCAAADLDFLTGLKERGAAFGSPSVFVYTLTSAAPGESSIALALRGPLVTVSAGTASAATALATAADGVMSGRYPACLVGALEIGTLGSRRAYASAAGPGDSLALFVLERAQAGVPGARLVRWETGFGEAPEVAADVSGPALASALVNLPGRRELVARSPEGFWARLELSPA